MAYLTYTNFQTEFANAGTITETDFDVLEPIAEELMQDYCGKSLPSTNPISYACGLIIQNMVAVSLREKSLSQYSAGGIMGNQTMITDIIPNEAKLILDKYKEIVL